MSESKQVGDYFHEKAFRFDSIYDENKTPIHRWLDNNLRKDMHERFVLTIRICDDIEGRSALDVGCGSGRYDIEFAHRGAQRVLGIDLADQMIDLARDLAQKAQYDAICEFVQGDFLTYELDEQFDYSIAIGVFDYVQDAVALLTKMRSVTTRRVVASFPTKSILRQQVRHIRYRLKNVPLYFYNRSDIERLLKQVGVTDYEITKIKGWGYDYVVSVSPD